MSKVNCERVVRNEKMENGTVVSKAGRYASEPEGKHTNDKSLFEKGTSRNVETTPGIAERNVLLILNNRILLNVLPLDRIMIRPLVLDLPANHFLRKVRVGTSDLDNQRDLKDRMCREALEVMYFFCKTKVIVWTLLEKVLKAY